MVISPQNYSSKSASCGAAHWDTQWLLFSPCKEQQSLQDGRCHLIAVVSPQTPRHTNSFLKGLWKVPKWSRTASTFYDILKGSFQWIRPTNITKKQSLSIRVFEAWKAANFEQYFSLHIKWHLPIRLREEFSAFSKATWLFPKTKPTSIWRRERVH